jgi:hypothetical protein
MGSASGIRVEQPSLDDLPTGRQAGWGRRDVRSEAAAAHVNDYSESSPENGCSGGSFANVIPPDHNVVPGPLVRFGDIWVTLKLGQGRR